MAVIDVGPVSDLQPSYYFDGLLSGGLRTTSKILALKNMYPGVSISDFVSKVATHAMDNGGGNTIPNDKKAVLGKMGTAGGNPYADPTSFYNAGRNFAAHVGYDLGCIMTSEIGEEVGIAMQNQNPGADWDTVIQPAISARTNAFHKGFADAMMEHNSVPLGDVKSYGEYGSFHIPNQGQASGVFGSSGKLASYRISLENQTNAKRQYNASTDSFSSQDDKYFAEGRVNAHNFMPRLYYQSMHAHGGAYLANMLFQAERMYAAAPDRRQMVFTWDKIQDLERQNEFGQILPFLDGLGGNSFKFSNPAGTLSISHGNGIVVPFDVCEIIAFYYCVYGEGVFVWSDTDGILNVPPEGHEQGLYGGYEDGPGNPYVVRGNVRKWKPDGGVAVDYSPGNPLHPKYYDNSAAGGFNRLPITPINGFRSGHDRYGRCEPYLSGRWKYAEFSTDGGGTYYTPASGSAGTYISGYQQPNYYSQHPVLDPPYYHQPWAHFNNGVCVYFDPYTLPWKYKNVVFRDGGNTYNMGALPGSKLIIKIFT